MRNDRYLCQEHGDTAVKTMTGNVICVVCSAEEGEAIYVDNR